MRCLMNSAPKVSSRWETPLKASAVVLTVGISLTRMISPATAADGKNIDFAADVQPIFKASCVDCHSVDPNKPRKKSWRPLPARR